MTYGPFGGITGHHFICIQSMDGMLMFFEQDSYAFGCCLPGFLLPGPLSYCSRTDSFIIVSSTRQVECYRYETLAVTADADIRKDCDKQSKTPGKRLTADWTLVLGEEVLDICVPNTSPTLSSIFVLGERNLFCLKDNGQIRFMKKLEFNPSCFLPYGSVSDDSTNILMGNHNNMLLVYQDVTLKWAAQLSFVPVVIRVANFEKLKGLVVTLNSDGHLQCSYMGTDPSFFTAPKVDSRDINYNEVDKEMKVLQKVIRKVTNTQDTLPRAEKGENISLIAKVSPNLDEVSCAVIPEMNGMSVPSITVKVKVRSSAVVQSPKMTVCVQPPLAVTQDQFVFDSMGSGCELVVQFAVFLNGHYPPADLCVDVAVSYSSATGVPSVSQCKFTLPLRLVCSPSSPCKSAKYKITVDTNKPPINLNEVFPDFSEKSENKDNNAMGFQLINGSKVTVLTSKTSQRYRIQSESFEDIWLIAKELVQRFNQHFSSLGVKDFRNSFTGPVPLSEYFETVDHHFELRRNAQKYQDLLSERAVQFRAIQRHLLTRFKDKNPGPLQNLDTLMEGTYHQVIALADAADDNRECLIQAFARLRSASHLLILLLSLWRGLSSEQAAILEATLLPLLQDTPQLVSKDRHRF
ncbi:protein PTHB1 [Triplophysa rosa]|nr:protein PTHB1 [Triplophysa rosa]